MRSTSSTVRKFFLIFLNVFYFSADADDQFKSAQDVLQSTHGKIIFSAMLFRHGHRTPYEDFPTNKYSKIINHKGKLTKEGKVSAYKLGIWAKERYDHLIRGKAYSSELFNVISSFSDRCVASAQLFLAGFYPPIFEETEKWNANIPWQPIPVYTNPPKDRMFRMEQYCASYNHQVERIKDSPEIVKFYHDYKGTMDLIKTRGPVIIPQDSDPKIRHIQRISFFFDTLSIHDQLGFDIPDWATDIYPRDKDAFTVMYLKLLTYNHEMKRVKGGPFLNHIINELKNKRENPQSEKLFQFYAGHDWNIITLLNMLNVWDGTLAKFSSALLFELRNLDGNYIVTVLFKSSDEAPQLMEIPTCPSPCTLERFIEVTKPFIPEDWENECRTITPDYNAILF